MTLLGSLPIRAGSNRTWAETRMPFPWGCWSGPTRLDHAVPSDQALPPFCLRVRLV